MVNVIYTDNYYVYTYRGGEGATSRGLFLGLRARVPSTRPRQMRAVRLWSLATRSRWQWFNSGMGAADQSVYIVYTPVVLYIYLGV